MSNKTCCNQLSQPHYEPFFIFKAIIVSLVWRQPQVPIWGPALSEPSAFSLKDILT